MSVAVVLDACVLYPAPLRDVLMRLSLAGLFRPKWTDEIHEEWISNLLIQRPDLKRTQLERTRDLMNLYTLDALVQNYHALIPKISLPDTHDRHVLAAAIKSKANTIVTYNLKDFPDKTLKKYGIKAMHPDDFIMDVFLADSEKVWESIEALRLSLKNPPLSWQEYLLILKRQQLDKFVHTLKNLI